MSYKAFVGISLFLIIFINGVACQTTSKTLVDIFVNDTLNGVMPCLIPCAFNHLDTIIDDFSRTCLPQLALSISNYAKNYENLRGNSEAQIINTIRRTRETGLCGLIDQAVSCASGILNNVCFSVITRDLKRIVNGILQYINCPKNSRKGQLFNCILTANLVNETITPCISKVLTDHGTFFQNLTDFFNNSSTSSSMANDFRSVYTNFYNTYLMGGSLQQFFSVGRTFTNCLQSNLNNTCSTEAIAVLKSELDAVYSYLNEDGSNPSFDIIDCAAKPGVVFGVESCASTFNTSRIMTSLKMSGEVNVAGFSIDVTKLCDIRSFANNCIQENLVNNSCSMSAWTRTTYTTVTTPTLEYLEDNACGSPPPGTGVANISSCSRFNFTQASGNNAALNKTSNIELLTNCSNSPIILIEGGDGVDVQVRGMVQPSSLCGSTANCKIYVRINILPGLSPRCFRTNIPIEQVVCQVVNGTDLYWCAKELTDSNYLDATTLTLAAVIDGKEDGTQFRTMRVFYVKAVGGQIVEQSVAGECSVEVVDRDSSTYCKSQNDPHMRTYDSVQYEAQHSQLNGATVVLTRNTKMPYQVQVKLKSCGRAKCNCAVAIQFADFVYAVDACSRPTRQTMYSSSPNKNTYNIGISVRDRRYQVQLPTGTRVSFSVYGTFMNVYVYPSPQDFNSTEGLCGLYDQVYTNDFVRRDGTIEMPTILGSGRYRRVSFNSPPDTFTNSWIVQNANESIFEGVPSGSYNIPSSYCTCTSSIGTNCNGFKCGPGAAISDCDRDNRGQLSEASIKARIRRPGNPSQVQSRNQVQANGRKKRQTLLTVEEATTFCNNAFNNPVTTSCGTNADTAVANFIDECIKDIELAGDTSFTEQSIAGAAAECENNIATTPALTEDNPDIDVITSLIGAMCEENCNNRGTCNEQVCTCNSGYAGDTCRLATNTQPTLYGIDSLDAICDLSDQTVDCGEIVIIADDIISGGAVTCHITEHEISQSGVAASPTGSSYTEPALVFGTSISCIIPADRRRQDAHALRVRLSNDGTTESVDYILVIIAPSNCNDCIYNNNETPPTATCTRKTTVTGCPAGLAVTQHSSIGASYLALLCALIAIFYK